MDGPARRRGHAARLHLAWYMGKLSIRSWKRRATCCPGPSGPCADLIIYISPRRSFIESTARDFLNAGVKIAIRQESLFEEKEFITSTQETAKRRKDVWLLDVLGHNYLDCLLGRSLPCSSVEELFRAVISRLCVHRQEGSIFFQAEQFLRTTGAPDAYCFEQRCLCYLKFD